MPRATPIINSFAGGEISPHLDARSDLQWYFSSCRRLENMIPRAQGGAVRRGGTRFIAEVKDPAKRTALIPFEFSTQQAYVIEAGDRYFRFYKDKGRIESPPGTPYEIASPYSLANLFDADGRLRLKYTQSADVLYLVHPDYAPRKLSRTGHTAWTLDVIDFKDGPYFDENTTSTTLVASSGSGTVTIAASSVTGINDNTGFKTADIGRLLRLKNGANWSWLKITAFADTTHVTAEVKGGTAPTSSTAAWQIGLWSDPDGSGEGGWPTCVMFFEERLMFGGAAARPNRWDGSASGDFETFTPGTDDAAAVAFTIASDQVNAIRWMAPANKLILGTLGAEFAAGGSGSIDASITPTNVNVRLQTRHGVADVAPALVGSSSILFVQRQGRKLREIAFSFEADGYVSEDMTVRAEHITRGGLVQLAWQQEPFGVLWAVRQDGRLLGFTYLRSQQVTAWHQHPLADGAAAEAIASIPGPGSSSGGDDQLWLIARRTIDGQAKRYVELLEPPLADDGDLVNSFYVDSGLTYDGKANAVLTPGAGAVDKGATGVVFTTNPAAFVSTDVGREIRYHVAADPGANPPVPGVEARAVITGYTAGTEVTAKILGAFPDLAPIPANAWRLSVKSVAGLGHLEGAAVQIVTDGAVHPAKIVTDGEVGLDYAATVVHVGLGYTSALLPVKFEAGSAPGSGNGGTAQGKKKRVSKVTLRLHRTLGCKIGRPSSSQDGAAHLDELPFRDYGGLMDAPPPLFTGDKEVTFRGNYDTSGDVLVVQDQPLPLAVLAAMPVLATAEGG